MVKVEASQAGDAWSCRVTVDFDGEHTEHQVAVSRQDLARWGRGAERAGVEDLVRRSFEFLLQREPPGSILESFELSVIPRYFPEYDRAIGRQ